MNEVEVFCRQVRERSQENRQAMSLLHGAALLGQAVGVLRQELDSMVRVIYLLSVTDRVRRAQLITAAASGKSWKGAKSGRVTDREMVELAQELHGWTGSVYRFGCAFIHLSSYHDYKSRDPIEGLDAQERSDLLKGLLLELRFRFDQYINLRPVKLFPGVETPLAGKTPKDLDFVVVRENTEDMYVGMGGFLKKGTPDEVAMQTAVYTRKGCERCIRWAFNYTRKRNQKKRLTLVAKTNVLTYGHDLWWRTFQDVAKEYPDIETDYNHVDACCMWMVKNPEHYDVIVTTNMFGDIITDLAGILQGGMGVAAGGNINPEPGGTSMFEPMGGSAPKYTGKGMINPIAAISAAAMLLEHTGHEKAAARVMKAIQTVTGTKMKSQAAGRMGYTTSQVGDLVCEAL